MPQHDFLEALKEEMPTDFGKDLLAQLKAQDAHMSKQKRKQRPSAPSFWTLAVASILAVMLGGVLVFTRSNTQDMAGLQDVSPSLTNYGQLSPQTAQNIEVVTRFGQPSAYNMQLSPDGEQLLVATSTGLYLHKANNLNEPAQLLPPYDTSVAMADFDADGNIYGLFNNTETDEYVTFRTDAQTYQYEELYRETQDSNTVTQPAVVHRVQAGETMLSIAAQYADTYTNIDTFISDVLNRNNIEASDLRVGDELIIQEAVYGDVIAYRDFHISPDGRQVMMVICNSRGSCVNPRNYEYNNWFARFYNTATGDIVREIQLAGNLPNVGMSPDWSTLAYPRFDENTDDLMLAFYDTNTQTSRDVLLIDKRHGAGDHPNVTRLIEFSDDGSLLVLSPVSEDASRSHVWSVERLRNANRPFSVLWRDQRETGENPDYTLRFGLWNSVAVASDNSAVYGINSSVVFTFDLANNRDKQQSTETVDHTNLDFDGSYAVDMDISNDDETLYLMTQGTLIQRIDVATGDVLEQNTDYTHVYNKTYQFADDGRLLITGEYSTNATLWDLSNDVAQRELFFPSGNPNPIEDALLSPDGRYLIYREDEGTGESLKVWVQDLMRETPRKLLITLTQENISGMIFTPSGDLVMVSHSGYLRTWNESDHISDEPTPSAETERFSNLRTQRSFFVEDVIDFAPDASIVAIPYCAMPSRTELQMNCSEDGVYFWNIADGTPSLIGQATDERIVESSAVAFSPDGQWVAYGYCIDDEEFDFTNTDLCNAGEITIYDVSALYGADEQDTMLEPVAVLGGFDGAPTTITWQPQDDDSSDWLLGVTTYQVDNRLVTFDGINTLTDVVTLPNGVGLTMTFSPDGNLIISSDKSLYNIVWGVAPDTIARND